MTRFILSVATALLISTSAQATSSQSPAIWVLADLSEGNPLVDSTSFAAKAGRQISAEISQLPYHAEVHFRTFGVLDEALNPLSLDYTLNARARPQNIGGELGTLIGALPLLAKKGRVKIQSQTNIFGALEAVGKVADCQTRRTHIFVLGDGLQYGGGYSAYDALKRGDHRVPSSIVPGSLTGCHIRFLGAGEGLTAPGVKQLHRLLQSAMTQAKVASVRTLRTW